MAAGQAAQIDPDAALEAPKCLLKVVAAPAVLAAARVEARVLLEVWRIWKVWNVALLALAQAQARSRKERRNQ